MSHSCSVYRLFPIIMRITRGTPTVPLSLVEHKHVSLCVWLRCLDECLFQKSTSNRTLAKACDPNCLLLNLPGRVMLPAAIVIHP